MNERSAESYGLALLTEECGEVSIPEPAAPAEIDYPAILERQRTAIADAVNAMRKALGARRWLCEGHRGSYAYDDDRFYGEFKDAIAEFDAALLPLGRIAADFSYCPESWSAIVKARDSAPAEIATVETAPHGIVLKIAGKPVCSWGIGQGGYQAEGLAAAINAALVARQSRAETALARAVGPEWAARMLAGRDAVRESCAIIAEGYAGHIDSSSALTQQIGDEIAAEIRSLPVMGTPMTPDPRDAEIERLKAHVARLDEAFNRSDKRQIWQDGFDTAKELVLSVKVGASWGPKATPDDGVELALKAMKHVFERSEQMSKSTRTET